MWVAVFFLIIFTGVAGLYYCTLKIDYTWRWYRVPQYFFYNDEVEVEGLNGIIVIVGKKGK